MKKILFFFILVCSLTSSINSQTQVSGHISVNTTWLSTSSPYIITDNLYIDSGFVLTIEPGVTVLADTGKLLVIDGGIIAQGNQTDSILFGPHLAGINEHWGGIYFSNNSIDAIYNDVNLSSYVSGSVLSYCSITKGGVLNGSDYKAVLKLNGAHPFISHCSIRNNFSTGIYAENSNNNLKISECSVINNVSNNFDSNNAGGLCITGNANVLIEKNDISNNIASATGPFSSNAGGIYFGGSSGSRIINNSVTGNSAPASPYASAGAILSWVYLGEISNNLISGNYSQDGVGGVRVMTNNTLKNNIIYNNSSMYGAGGASVYIDCDFRNNLVAGNSAMNGGGLLSVYGSYIINNIIADNVTDTIGMGGGINWWGCCTGGLSNNHIVRNTAGNGSAIYFDSGMQSFYHNTITLNTNTNNAIDSNATLVIKSNYVFNDNNIMNNTAAYTLFNYEVDDTSSIDATNNWWGTDVDSLIRNEIYNWQDTATLQVINYTPFLISADTLAPVAPPLDVQKTNLSGGQVKLTWRKNIESDLAGYRVYYGNYNGYSFANSIDVASDTFIVLSGVAVTDVFGVTAYDNLYSAANEFDSTLVPDNMVNGNESWFSYAFADCSTISLAVSSTDATCSTCNDGSALAVISGGTAPYQYTWNTTPEQNLAAASSLLPGVYTVLVSDFNGCSLTDSVVILSGMGIKETSLSSQIIVYPNPTSSTITLKQNQVSEFTVQIFNYDGVLVHRSNVSGLTKVIDLSELSNGIYFMECTSDKIRSVIKIVIQK